jgi:hypothetical protein
MAHLHEFFGYRATDRSPEAIASAHNEDCPFQQQGCTKKIDGIPTGACSLKMARSEPVIICPIRLYAEDHQILQHVADKAFGPGLKLVPGGSAVALARALNHPVVAVFGKGWGGELRLPQRSGGGSYYVDWILALIVVDGSLNEFVAVEVQTIDTTGNYLASRMSLLEPERLVVESKAGLNWENVSKRIIPQLIYKGQLLQREDKCKKGIFFVCPTQVYERVMTRVGGAEGLSRVPLQPHAITFMGYDYVPESERIDGQTVALRQEVEHTTSVSRLQDRFGNVALPDENVYQAAIQSALYNLSPRPRR